MVLVACGSSGGSAPSGHWCEPYPQCSIDAGPIVTRDQRFHNRRGKREATTPLPVVEKNEKEFLSHIGLGGEQAGTGQKKK